MKLNNNKILITGGATGIGFGLAQRFVQENNQVIICGRRKEALQAAKEQIPSLVTHACDLSEPAGREALFKWIGAEHADTNVVVNNAGIQNWMSVADEDFMVRARQEISINVEAPVHLSSLFLQHPALTTLVNVTSGLCFVPLVKVPVYCATKAFLHSFTISLRQQCKARGVEVVELIPPALNTDLGGKGLHDGMPPVQEFVDAVFTQLAAGESTATFGFTQTLEQAGHDVLGPIFERMNQL